MLLWAINLRSSMFKNQGIFIYSKYKYKKGRFLENSHQEITMKNVQIMNKNYSNYYKRKVSEAIYIKTNGPLINTQETSVPLS